MKDMLTCIDMVLSDWSCLSLCNSTFTVISVEGTTGNLGVGPNGAKNSTYIISYNTTDITHISQMRELRLKEFK